VLERSGEMTAKI
jgi:hypothetical protein